MQPEPQQQNQPTSGWQFKPNQQSSNLSQSQQPVADNQDKSQDIEMPEVNQQTFVSWTASEFIAYQKDTGWYIKALLVLVVIAGLSYLITSGDIASVVIIVIVIGVFISFASRQPRTLTYQVTNKGLQVGEKLYAYNTLKSFAVIDEGNINSIDLIPLKRFMPSVSIYFDPKDETAIVQALGEFLPKEDRQQAPIDKLMHKIRF